MRYYSYSRFLKEYFGEKIYKICINAGLTCPNRDGSLGVGGCIFCSQGGSGEFAQSHLQSVAKQIEEGRKQTEKKYHGSSYIAYFQAFTNTYTSPSHLEEMIGAAMDSDRIAAVILATRPDCLPEDILDVLSKAAQRKPLFIEMGLQTCHDTTADFLNRAYPTSVFDHAVMELYKRGIRVSAHVIAGLPTETAAMQFETVDHLNRLPISGIKISMLNVLAGSRLADYYRENPFHLYSMEEYVDILIGYLERLREDIVIERLTGDGPKSILIAPKWIGHKRLVLNTIQKEMKKRNTWQGRLYRKENIQWPTNP